MKKQHSILSSLRAKTHNRFRKGSSMFNAKNPALVIPTLLAGLLVGCGGGNDPDPQNVPFQPSATSADISGSAVKGSLSGAKISVTPLKKVSLTLTDGGTTDQNGEMLLEVSSQPGFGIDTLFKVTVTADASSSMICDAAQCGTAILGGTITGDEISGTTLSTLGYVSVPYTSSADGTADTHVQASVLSTLATSLIEAALAEGRNLSSVDLFTLAQAEFSSQILRAIGWQTSSANVFSMPIVSAESVSNFVTGTECEDVQQTDENNQPVVDGDGNPVTEQVCSDVFLDEASIKMSLINAAFAQFAEGSSQQASLAAAMANLSAAFAEEPDALMAFRQPLFDAIAANPVTAELGLSATDVIDLTLPLKEEASSSGPMQLVTTLENIATATISARSSISDNENETKLFDNDLVTKWLDNEAIPTSEAPTWVQIDFAEAQAVNTLIITSANDAESRDPENFTLLGSNDDGATWVVLTDVVGASFDDRLTAQTFSFANELAYNSYRFNITKNKGGVELTQIAEIQMLGPVFISVNHTSEASFVASARDSIGDAENQDKAFDGQSETKWLDNQAVPTVEEPTWIQVDFAEAVAVNQLAITSANDAPARDPENFALWASNDAGTTWIEIGNWVGEVFDGRFERKIFRATNQLAYSTYRLNITKNAGNVDLMQVAEIGLIGPQYASTDLTSAAGTVYSARAAISDGESAAMAFDDSTATKWLDNGGVPTEAEPSWVQVDLPASRVVSSLAITSANDAPARDPENFALLGSNDGGETWVVVASFVGESWDERLQRRTFDFTNGLSFSSYRLQITKNSGNTDLMQISEIELIGLDQ